MTVQVFRAKELEKIAEESIPNYRKIKNEMTKDECCKSYAPKNTPKRKTVRRSM